MRLFELNWQPRIMPDFLLCLLEGHKLVSARTNQRPGLVVQFVIYLRTVDRQLAELIPEQIRIVLFAHHTHVFDLVDRTDDAERKMRVVRVPEEVLRVEKSVRQISQAKADKLPVDSVIKVVSANTRVDSILGALAALIDFV